MKRFWSILAILFTLGSMGCSSVLLKVDDLREELTRSSLRPPPETLEVRQVSLPFSMADCRRVLHGVLASENLKISSSESDSVAYGILTSGKPLQNTETTRSLFTCERRGTYSVDLRLTDAGSGCLLSVSAAFTDEAEKRHSNCESTGQVEHRLQALVAEALYAEERRREEELARQENQRRTLREREAEEEIRRAKAAEFAKLVQDITAPGYPLRDTVRVFEGTLELVDSFNEDPYLDARFYVCAGTDSAIKAILVELHNSNVPGGANLLAFAPMILYQRLSPSRARSESSESDYGVVNYLSRTVSEGTYGGQDWTVFAVQPGETKRMLFQYGPTFNQGSGGTVPPYRTVCAMALRGLDEMYGVGSAAFRVGEEGKFTVKELRRYRGKRIPPQPTVLSPDPQGF